MVRQAGPQDCEQVYRLMCILEEQTLCFERFSAIYRTQLDSERYLCLVEERDGNVIGTLNLRFEAQLHRCARNAEILEFVISPAVRGQGIGKEMFAYACRAARAAGCSQIELSSNGRRTDAHRFYAREGMRKSHVGFTMPLPEESDAENTGG